MQLLPEIEKDGSISNVLKVGQEVLVQIAKEPISTKGPRLTSELSFAGRYIVLIPFADKVSVSTKSNRAKSVPVYANSSKVSSRRTSA